MHFKSCVLFESHFVEIKETCSTAAKLMYCMTTCLYKCTMISAYAYSIFVSNLVQNQNLVVFLCFMQTVLESVRTDIAYYIVKKSARYS